MPRIDLLPLAWIILDGWGVRDEAEGNAIRQAAPRHMDELAARFPSLRLEASATAVGLPRGYMGNSEVGHLCLGAGRTVQQPLGAIFGAIADGTFFENPALRGAFSAARSGGGAVHLMGLVSDGGVHSHLDHARALVEMARRERCERLYVHVFTDGRDTPPDSGLGYVASLEETLREHGVGRIASVQGRYFAMDRDRRWDRIARAYQALVAGEGHSAASAAAAVQAAYDRGETDEFIAPTIVREEDRPVAVLQDGDAVIFFNFRPDRARQISHALTDGAFDEFPRGTRPRLASFTCFMSYDASLDLPAAFRKEQPRRVFGEVLAAHGIPQVRCAETEKYAHVTYFFNGVREEPFEGEDRILVPSAKVATYDLQPEMRAREVTERVLAQLAPARLLVVNFANADMVGHTGVYDATVEACRITDGCVGVLAKRILELGGSLVVTADHGNAEQMIDPRSGGPHTAHTTNPVPVIFAGPAFAGRGPASGGQLADVAPTILEVLEIPIPEEMTGTPLLR